jgi:transcriptional regulator with XRE-family HTH domain
MSRDLCPVEPELRKRYQWGMVKRFADAFEDALAATGLSAAKVCELAGVSEEQIKKMRQRARKGLPASTNVDDAWKIGRALGLTLDELLQDDTAQLRSEAAALWRKLSQEEREILIVAARGRRAPGPDPEQ